ncbi:hypothetical protein EVAR_72389_1 [Eumeta japonica]|uniref:Uncharacterized protein n=1 Tax=Eumeta variegata TaxID=151549 RepID=A0A4C1TG52_EUMVA|nr:hypothetical protein EVAR_72389_1 [Eumeta japonica]
MLLPQLRQTWDNLIQESDLLTPIRSQRGALGIVGNATHALFGVLYSDYAKQMALTAINLRSEIAKIRGHLPMGHALPIEDSDLLEPCKIMSIQEQNHIFDHVENKLSFVALTTINHWLNATPNSLELTAVCGSEPIQLHLIIKGNMLTIHGHETSVTVLHASYTMFGNITSIEKPSEAKKLLKPNIILDTKLEEFTNSTSLLFL